MTHRGSKEDVMKKSKNRQNYNSDFLVLYSGYSKRLINGREADRNNNVFPIYGFDKFAKKMRIIWNAAEKDNPYALWFLKRINDKIDIVESTLSMENENVKSLFDDGLDIDYRDFKGTKEVKYPLNLKPPYSWMLARNIKQFDDYILRLFKLNSIGLMNDKNVHQNINVVNKTILACIKEAVSYYDINVTREDIDNGNDTYAKASEHMGVVPPAILTGELKADYLPKIKDKKEAK